MVMEKNEVCPRDETADPPGSAELPIDIHGFAEGLVSFRTLCGVQSKHVLNIKHGKKCYCNSFCQDYITITLYCTQ